MPDTVCPSCKGTGCSPIRPGPCACCLGTGVQAPRTERKLREDARQLEDSRREWR